MSSNGNDLTTRANGMGYRANLPQGATNIEQDGNGHYRITINNEVKIFNADGTPAADSNTPRVPEADRGSADAASRGNGNGSGNPQSASVFSPSTMNAGFNIDSFQFGAAARNTDAIVGLGQNIPFGLGGQFTSEAIARNLAEYMNSVQFNFDFSNYNPQGTALNQPVLSYPGSSNPTAAASQTGSSSGRVLGNTVVEVDGSYFTVDELAESQDLKKSAKEGFYYDSDGKYYKYDLSTKEFVDATERETKIAKKADERAAENANGSNGDASRPSASQIKIEAADISFAFYDAMDGVGTDEDELIEASKKINKDNVIEVIDMWNDKYDHDYDSDDLGLFGSIQDELSGDDQDTVEDNIARALCERAESLGLNDEADEFYATIKSARKSRGSGKDAKVKEAFEDLVAKIKAKESERTH